MAIINPAQRRSLITDANGKLEIIIPSRKNLFLILFLGAWLIGWAFGEFTVPITFFHKTKDHVPLLFMSVWLLMWTIGGAFALYTWFWQAFGREIVTVDSGFLSIKKDIFGLGNTDQYQVGDVKNLRIGQAFYNPFDFRSSMQFWGLGGGNIAFDYGSKTYRFATGLDEAEAREIINRILKNHPSLDQTIKQY